MQQDFAERRERSVPGVQIAPMRAGTIGPYRGPTGWVRMILRRRLMVLTALTAIAAIALPYRASADGPAPNAAPSSPFVVYCFDRDRDIVNRMLASQCKGKVVSEEEAKAIQERRNQRIAHILNAAPPTEPEGLRLSTIGTAFFVDETARLLTNNHIVEDCKAVTVASDDQKDLPATVLATDPKNDLALLQVAADNHPVATFHNADTARANSFVAIVGYPDQGLAPLEPIISAGTLIRAIDDTTMDGNIFFKADVRHGNSGGPIFNSRGSVIEIVKAKVDTVRTYSATNREIDDTGVGVGLPIVLEFLRRNDARYRVEKRDNVLNADQIMTQARFFVVRAECWK